jgi:hypothetical protein
LATTSSAGSSVLTGTPYSARSPAAPFPIAGSVRNPKHSTAILGGAALAAALAVTALVVRSRVRRRARDAQQGSGVLGVLVKSALFAAVQTVARVGAARLLAKALPPQPAPAHEAGPSE